MLDQIPLTVSFDLQKEAAKRFDLDAARKELKTKTLHQIEIATAYTWASRAVVSFENFKETGEVRWLIDANTYLSEAVEHASQANDGGTTLAAVEKTIQKAKKNIPDDLKVEL